MGKKTVNFELSIKGLMELKEYLTDYKDSLQSKIDKLTSTLAYEGVQFAISRVQTYDAIFTGELIASIKAEYEASGNNNCVFFIVADSNHAAFVEFGTGQVGSEAPYPYEFPKDVNWKYNTGKTIFEIAPGEYGWFYPGQDGRWYFTQGMPSRPFMRETTLELMTIVNKVAKEVFK